MTGMWITIVGSAIGNPRDGYHVAYDWDRQRFGDKSEAITNGFRLRESGDFNIGFIRNGRLKSLWWMDREMDSAPETLARLAREIGLTA